MKGAQKTVDGMSYGKYWSENLFLYIFVRGKYFNSSDNNLR